MNLKLVKTLGIVALAISATLTVTGCTVNINSPQLSQADQQKDNATNHQIQNQYVLMFAQMMIPHHQQAIDISTLAETRASSAAVKKLASQIKSEQAPEIKTMMGWLKEAGSSLPTKRASSKGNGMGKGMGMGMNGTLTDAQITELKAASGAAFDKLFLKDMIAHHEGAIKMAKMALKAKTAKVGDLANAIVKSQTAEIKTMKALLAK